MKTNYLVFSYDSEGQPFGATGTPEAWQRAAGLQTAAKGLEIPADAPPGILAEIVAAAHGLIDFLRNYPHQFPVDCPTGPLESALEDFEATAQRQPGLMDALFVAARDAIHSASLLQGDAFGSDAVRTSAKILGGILAQLDAPAAAKPVEDGPDSPRPCDACGGRMLDVSTQDTASWGELHFECEGCKRVRTYELREAFAGKPEPEAGLAAAYDRVSGILEDPAAGSGELREAVIALLDELRPGL